MLIHAARSGTDCSDSRELRWGSGTLRPTTEKAITEVWPLNLAWSHKRIGVTSKKNVDLMTAYLRSKYLCNGW